MTLPAIQVHDLRKVYKVSRREPGVRAAFQGLLHRQVEQVRAVDGISFTLEPGGIIGFLGPNGAGKTTTIKMLSGLLYPTSGEVSVLGHSPWEREKAFLRQITLVMGQRNELIWDIPALDSFELNRAIYDIPFPDYRRMLSDLTDLLELGNIVTKPVRNLSLGERMKCEIALALLHHPQMVFLDEPTIGLDVTMQRRIRTFISDYNQRTGATILLTSHYMADVQALCQRILIIHNGHLLFDGNLCRLMDQFTAHKTIVVQVADPRTDLRPYGDVVSHQEGKIALRVPKNDTARVTERLLASETIIDLLVEDPPIEEVIERAFAQATMARPAALEA